MVRMGSMILAIMAAVIFAYWLIFMRGIVYTDDARFGGHMVDVSPEISGRLIEVAVHEGLFVRKGTVVFRLDPAILESSLKQAEAKLISARATLDSSKAIYQRELNGSRPEEIRAGEATAGRLQTEEAMAQLEYDRASALYKDRAVTQDTLDRARAAFEADRQSLENANENLILLREGPRAEDIAAAKAAAELAQSRVAEASAAVDNARSDLARCTVRAPFDGWVVRRWLDPGAMPMTRPPCAWTLTSRRRTFTMSRSATRLTSRSTPSRLSTFEGMSARSCVRQTPNSASYRPRGSRAPSSR
jgi:multidrug resistance efflux pump